MSEPHAANKGNLIQMTLWAKEYKGLELNKEETMQIIQNISTNRNHN